MLLFFFISILNFFFSIFIKIILKNICTSLTLTLKKNRIRINLNDLTYKNTSFDTLKLSITKNFFPNIVVNHIEHHLNKLTPSAVSPKNFDLWSNRNELTRSFNRFNIICNNLLLFNIFIKSLRVYYSKDLYLDIFGINIFKLTNKDSFIRLKISTIKIYYSDTFIGKINKLKITLRPGKTIYCDKISILFHRFLLDDRFLYILSEFNDFLNSNDCDAIPKIMVKNIQSHIYLHNYIAVTIDNFIFEHYLLHLGKIKVKIWKKDSIWIDNFKINILAKHKKPIIENIRIRLFDSTSDKLYKSLIILRKKFISVAKKPLKQTYPIKDFVINKNYIKSLDNKLDECADVTTNLIIDEYLALINNAVINYKLTIINLVIKLSYEYGEIYAENLTYTINENCNILAINNWKFYDNKTVFIEKFGEDDAEFYIKFNKTSTHITPYKMKIYFDVIYFRNMCRILKKTIERINNLFYSSYYIYNKGYVYEHFHIESFMGVLNYKKTHKNFKSLLEGNSIELLNYIDIEDLHILLDEVILSYPKDWTDIIHKIASVYKKSIYNSNFKSIVTKISGEKTASILFIKDNLKYFKKKLVNSLTKQP